MIYAFVNLKEQILFKNLVAKTCLKGIKIEKKEDKKDALIELLYEYFRITSSSNLSSVSNISLLDLYSDKENDEGLKAKILKSKFRITYLIQEEDLKKYAKMISDLSLKYLMIPKGNLETKKESIVVLFKKYTAD